MGSGRATGSADKNLEEPQGLGGKPCATLARREWWGCSAAFGGLEGQLAPGESKETLRYKLFFFWLLTSAFQKPSSIQTLLSVVSA